jgi:hypothetical protein
MLATVAGESEVCGLMPDYTICFDARWIFYPALTVCSAIFGIGLGAIIAQVRKHWRSHRNPVGKVAVIPIIKQELTLTP